MLIVDSLFWVYHQEKTDEARYYDAEVIDIQRKLHDIRGCRCIFLIRYEHDNFEVRKKKYNTEQRTSKSWMLFMS